MMLFTEVCYLIRDEWSVIYIGQGTKEVTQRT